MTRPDPPSPAPPCPASPSRHTPDAPRASAAQRQACAALLPQVSRTFALSIEALPEALRDAVRVAYLLCRILDTIEDEPAARLDPATRAALFTHFDALMRDPTRDPAPFAAACADAQLGAGCADAALVAEATAVFAVFRDLPPTQQDALRPCVLEMSRGMRAYADRADAHGALRLRDLDDLERYCYFVAGTVGELLTELFAQATPDLHAAALAAVREHAVSFGLGLQLVNIVKDVAADASRGVCFLPEALAASHHLRLDHLLDPAARPQALAVVHAVCARARDHLARAQRYTLQWPADSARAIRLFCAVPLVLALATLAEVERGADTLRPDTTPKVSRAVVAEALIRAQSAVDSDQDLRALFADYSTRPTLA